MTLLVVFGHGTHPDDTAGSIWTRVHSLKTLVVVFGHGTQPDDTCGSIGDGPQPDNTSGRIWTRADDPSGGIWIRYTAG